MPSPGGKFVVLRKQSQSTSREYRETVLMIRDAAWMDVSSKMLIDIRYASLLETQCRKSRPSKVGIKRRADEG